MLPIVSPVVIPAPGTPVNVAPWAIPLPEAVGLRWTDPREIHKVVVRFRGEPPANVRLQYWTSKWPQQRLPKDHVPGGSRVGWWELGNWYIGDWKEADTELQTSGNEIVLTFRPVNEKEYPEVRDFPATWRFTHQLRLILPGNSPQVERIEAYTDSVWQERDVRVVWATAPGKVRFDAFNAYVVATRFPSDTTCQLTLRTTHNPDPNNFDRTLVTVQWGRNRFTFDPRDLVHGPIVVPDLRVAVTDLSDQRRYAELAATLKQSQTIYQRVSTMPEQTWPRAWNAMPPKKADIWFPLGLDGGRQRFRLQPSGAIEYRMTNRWIEGRPGKDTPRLSADGEEIRFTFDLPDRPTDRTIADGCLPVCETAWVRDGIRYEQVAFATALEGTQPDVSPPGDTTAVALLRFRVTNVGHRVVTARFPLKCAAGPLEITNQGIITQSGRFRGQVVTDASPEVTEGGLVWSWALQPNETKTLVLKLPYVTQLTNDEIRLLLDLDFDREREAVVAFWRQRLDAGMRLITPEPMLTDFHRAHAGHLLINCEKEPGADRRFARVGSFRYAVFGNEACMMVIDLDRRGYHKEAEECLTAWLHYQGTVALPGDFASQDGVLYGAGGYEHGGYNQHHGWILWCLVEHYKYTRDERWLRHALPGILKGAEWIIRERHRTRNRTDIAKGLLPAGSLEDIRDWWPWLSTNCYTWMGLDAAAWALEVLKHPEAARLRKEANAYLRAIRQAFRTAADLTPVVRLRDGRYVKKIPSHPYLRGRAFGWICETLEGALHLLITRIVDPNSKTATDIIEDYEDNLYISKQFGYTLDDFEAQWFDYGGVSLQSCLLLDVEPYLYRDDIPHALRAAFNAIAVGYFADVRMIAEHVPEHGTFAGDHYKTSDEANAAGWLRYLFVREEGDELLIGQAIPKAWLTPGKTCGVERTVTHFGTVSVRYEALADRVRAHFEGTTRNPPKRIRLRFRLPDGTQAAAVTVNGKPARMDRAGWVNLPGDIGNATVEVMVR